MTASIGRPDWNSNECVAISSGAASEHGDLEAFSLHDSLWTACVAEKIGVRIAAWVSFQLFPTELHVGQCALGFHVSRCHLLVCRMAEQSVFLTSSDVSRLVAQSVSYTERKAF